MIDYYQNRRQEEKRSRHHKIVAVFFGVITILILAGLYWLVHSQILEIKNISINMNVQDEGLKQNIEQIFYSDLGNGSFSKIFFNDKNILIADIYKNSITSDIQKRLPLLKDVSIDADIFGRKVSINAETRERYAIWCSENTSASSSSSGFDSSFPECFWFDRTGFVFDGAPSTEGQLIYKVLDFSGAPISVGNYVLPDDEPGNLVGIFSLIDSIGVSYRTLYLKDRQLEEITSDITKPPVFYFSLRNNPLYALGALQALRGELNKFLYVDLRVTNRIYYK